MSEYRNRITRHAAVDPRMLTPHPENPRLHPKAQTRSLAAILSELGWLDDVIVNENTGNVLNGHARLEDALRHNEATVPVSYVDVTEAEERLILATYDPIAAMAEPDDRQAQALLESLRTGAGNAALQTLLDQLRPRQHSATTKLDLTPEERAQVYDNNPYRQIYLVFTERDYRDVIGQFSAVQSRYPALDSNAAIVRYLLDQEVPDAPSLDSVGAPATAPDPTAD